MLLEFKASNYKSFVDEFVFTMIPAPKQKGLDYSIIQKEAGAKTYKSLSSAIIYGPNASGKTNIISAMLTLKNIILRGNIRNDVGTVTSHVASQVLELIPNTTLSEPKPVSFSIKFIEKGLLINYSLRLDLGNFGDTNSNRRILSEELTINQKRIYYRDNDLSIEKIDTIKQYLVKAYEQNEESAIMLAKNNLDPEELFLANGFKTMFSSEIVSIIKDWLIDKLIVVFRADTMKLHGITVNTPKIDKAVGKFLFESAKLFGSNSNTLTFDKQNDKEEKVLSSVIELNGKEESLIIPAEYFESLGTLRFVNLYPYIVWSLIKGATLIVDEFDTSIHPMAIMNIITIFHNDEINKKGAQLIFNTHNPIFLNSNLLRRDEIKFVERDEETHLSEHYSLSDFKTTGASGVRNNEDYLKNYFINKYGAIKDIDFSDCIRNILERVEENDEEKI